LFGSNLLGEERPPASPRLAQDAQALGSLLGEHLGNVVAVDADGREALGAQAADHGLGLLGVAACELLGGLAHLDDQPLLGRREGREGARGVGVVGHEPGELGAEQGLGGLVDPPAEPGEVVVPPGDGLEALVGLADEQAAGRVGGSSARRGPRPCRRPWLRARPPGRFRPARTACPRGPASARRAPPRAPARPGPVASPIGPGPLGSGTMVRSPRAPAAGEVAPVAVRQYRFVFPGRLIERGRKIGAVGVPGPSRDWCNSRCETLFHYNARRTD